MLSWLVRCWKGEVNEPGRIPWNTLQNTCDPAPAVITFTPHTTGFPPGPSAPTPAPPRKPLGPGVTAQGQKSSVNSDEMHECAWERWAWGSTGKSGAPCKAAAAQQSLAGVRDTSAAPGLPLSTGPRVAGPAHSQEALVFLLSFSSVLSAL